MAAPMMAWEISLILVGIGWVRAKSKHSLTWRHGPDSICRLYHQTSEPFPGGRHVNIPVYTTFRRQNHGGLERFRPADSPRLAARDHGSERNDGFALAQADPVEAVRQLGANDDGTTQAGILPGRHGAEPAHCVRAIGQDRQGSTGP